MGLAMTSSSRLARHLEDAACVNLCLEGWLGAFLSRIFARNTWLPALYKGKACRGFGRLDIKSFPIDQAVILSPPSNTLVFKSWREQNEVDILFGPIPIGSSPRSLASFILLILFGPTVHHTYLVGYHFLLFSNYYIIYDVYGKLKLS